MICVKTFQLPKRSCGLSKGSRYRVIKSFSSGPTDFEEGEVLIFRGERFWDAVFNEDPDPIDHDIYDFEVADSRQCKMIFSNEIELAVWTQLLERVSEKPFQNHPLKSV